VLGDCVTPFDGSGDLPRLSKVVGGEPPSVAVRPKPPASDLAHLDIAHGSFSDGVAETNRTRLFTPRLRLFGQARHPSRRSSGRGGRAVHKILPSKLGGSSESPAEDNQSPEQNSPKQLRGAVLCNQVLNLPGSGRPAAASHSESRRPLGAQGYFRESHTWSHNPLPPASSFRAKNRRKR